jgi:hypothetical protein
MKNLNRLIIPVLALASSVILSAVMLATLFNYPIPTFIFVFAGIYIVQMIALLDEKQLGGHTLHYRCKSLWTKEEVSRLSSEWTTADAIRGIIQGSTVYLSTPCVSGVEE